MFAAKQFNYFFNYSQYNHLEIITCNLLNRCYLLPPLDPPPLLPALDFEGEDLAGALDFADVEDFTEVFDLTEVVLTVVDLAIDEFTFATVLYTARPIIGLKGWA